MTNQATVNLLWADALIDGIAKAGIRHVVVSPGSRSTPLVLACERHSEIKITTMVDERCAAFIALGMAIESRTPVGVIATSGSAPAHWYPAVIEANHSGIPLLLMSADRPPELQDCGANQTTNQKQMFGVQVRAFHDPGPAEAGSDALQRIRELGIEATQQASGQNPGPVHLNLPFREPLVPDVIPAPECEKREVSSTRIHLTPDKEQMKRVLEIFSNGPGAIICGPDCQEEGFPVSVAELSRRLGVPLIADPLSNLRFGKHSRSNIICHYDTFLRNSSFTERHRIKWLLRFGAAPVSKPLMQYLELCTPVTIVCAPRGDWPDPLHHTQEMVRADPTDLCNHLIQHSQTTDSNELLAEFQHAEEQLVSSRIHPAPIEKKIIEHLISAIPDGSTVFSSNSLPIRMLDSWSGGTAKPIRILANRGVSGIDGNISTLIGIASKSNGPVFGLIGDLACYHDMNGLLAAKNVDATLIVLNNGGGAIFGYLPQAQLDQFNERWLTPTGLDLLKVADLYGLKYHRTQDRSGFIDSLNLAMGESGVSVIEVIIDREQSLINHKAWLDASIKLHDSSV